MADLALLGDNNHLCLQNLKKNFSFVKNKVNELLGTDGSTSFSENPFVDIETIAANAGITKIEPVTPEKVYNEHARLEGTKILVNKDDSHEEQRFSIAHEIFHYLVNNGNKLPQAARSNLQHEIFRDQKGDIQEATAQAYKAIGKIIYENVGKPISERTKSIILGKIGVAVMKVIEKHLKNKKISKKEMNSFYNDIILKTIEHGIMNAIVEEIADYFAANLLVPTERFILWEDKTDKEIAQAFGVTEGCVRKRRNEEIEHELNFMVPQNQSSKVGIEEESPLSLDELDLVLEGCNNHDTGRV